MPDYGGSNAGVRTCTMQLMIMLQREQALYAEVGSGSTLPLPLFFASYCAESANRRVHGRVSQHDRLNSVHAPSAVVLYMVGSFCAFAFGCFVGRCRQAAFVDAGGASSPSLRRKHFVSFAPHFHLSPQACTSRRHWRRRPANGDHSADWRRCDHIDR
jgi:hypothetical protein